MSNHKVCPVVLRAGIDGIEALAHLSPDMGCRYVVGDPRDGEAATATARRLLKEASGIAWAGPLTTLGALPIGDAPQIWDVFLIIGSALPETWTYSPQGGSRSVGFFWQPLSADLSDQWQGDFHDLHAVLRACQSDFAALIDGRARS